MKRASPLRSILAALALACCALNAPLGAQTREPEAIVTALYEATVKGTMPAAFGVDPKDRKLLTKSLAAMWKKADKKSNPKGEDVGAIDFDIVSMSQDPNIKSFTVKTEKRDERGVTVVATFTIGSNNIKTGKKEIVRYDFVREDGAWKIDDVRSSVEKKPWSLRGNLEINSK